MHGDASADADWGRLGVGGDAVADAPGDFARSRCFRIRQHEGEFISAIARGSVNHAAMEPKSGSDTAERSATDQMAILVIDVFQAVQIEEDQSERPLRAGGTKYLRIHDINEAPIIGEAGERIAHRQLAHLAKKTQIVENRSAYKEGKAPGLEEFRQGERRIETKFRLARRE